jgi:hypothetical protein
MKKSMKQVFAALSLTALAVPAAVLAHHSYSMFDMQRTIVLEGTVVQFRWSNPHAFIRVNAQVNGKAEEWSIEMTSPNNLALEGWTRRTIQQGDKVKLHVHPLRSGAQGGAYAGIELPNGSTLGTVE